MVFLAALVIFALVTVAIWFTAVALFFLLTGGSDLRKNPNFASASGVSILLVTLISFIPFPAGYVLSLVVWWLTAKQNLELPSGRAMVLFLLLAALSIVSRLVILGVLSF
jgi:hypothetical protein